MMKIIENNYVPKTYVTKHTGYRVTCPSCKSIFLMEKSELDWTRDGSQTYTCPCCHTGQYFVSGKGTTKETWETTETR